jgi:hypothetical protein
MMKNHPNDAILLVWNPDRWEWTDIDEDAERARQGIHDPEDMWSVGNRTSIAEGTRFFMIRLGRDPRGIMASGRSVGKVFESPHWDEELQRAGRRVRRVRLRFERIINPNRQPRLPKRTWQSRPSTQCTGPRSRQGSRSRRRLPMHCSRSGRSIAGRCDRSGAATDWQQAASAGLNAAFDRTVRLRVTMPLWGVSSA